MIEGPAARRSPRLLWLRLGDHLIQTFGDGEFATVQSAVALLRTVFEDHYVDPEHQSCLFFHGCTLAGSRHRPHDFSVIHRGDRVFLSDFTFQPDGPAFVALPLVAYASEVVQFGAMVLDRGPSASLHNEWKFRLAETQWRYLRELVDLGRRYLTSTAEAYPALWEEFQRTHGQQKRMLELQILGMEAPVGANEPTRVRARVAFGPLRAHEVLPVRLNGGDVVLATVGAFTNEGVLLTLEGIGSGGIRPGDRLLGLQLFYP